MRSHVHSALILSILLLLSTFAHANPTNFTKCLVNIRDETWRASQSITDGGTDNRGRPVPISNTTTAITYDLCTKACGVKSAPTKWRSFSGKFSSWLLPWLALVSQLPFGAEDRLDNLIAVLLAVGSPTLAAYSLVLTVLNERWIARRFPVHSFDWGPVAVDVLRRLQQFHVVVPPRTRLLKKSSPDPSQRSPYVAIRWSNEWWSNLDKSMDHTHTWSWASVTSIVWVVIAYLFAVIDFFMSNAQTAEASYVNSDSLGVGSLWLWLLPIVVGWLQVSPKCDSDRLRKSFQDAEVLYREQLRREARGGTTEGAANVVAVANATEIDDGPDEVVLISFPDVPLALDTLHRDERCPVPIYNYTRLFTSTRVVEHVSQRFSSRVGHRVEARGPWALGVWSRMMIASVIALSLQWGTTGAAVVVVWFTPTIGLGCRSGSYFIYAALSTLVWMLLVAASVLSHHCSSGYDQQETWLVKWLSITLRRLGKTIGAINAIFILLSSMFQFTNVYDLCYCNSNVLMLGVKAYTVLELTLDDVGIMKDGYVVALLLASGTATFFWVFINLFIEPIK